MLTRSGIELLNEPRLTNFTMTELKAFYTAGSAGVWAASATMNVTIHGELDNEVR